ncbi:hypothetical protein Tco_0363509 [Tanacetum coccineum]
MSTLTFSDTHNMVAFLEKPAKTKAKTVNGERQLQALVDKKKVIITKTSIRSDLHVEDAGGTDCLPTATIFEELARMGRKQKKTIAVPYPSDSIADVPNEESVPTHSNDPLLSGEDRLKLTNLMDMCTKLFERVLHLEHTKTAQAQKITNLVEYSDDESLGAQVDASKQGRSIEDIDKDAKVYFVDETQGRSDDAKMFDTDALIGNDVFVENDMIEKHQDVIPKEVSTVAPSTTVVSPPVITEVKITLAQTLAKLKSVKSKVKKLKQTVKTAQARRRAKIVVSDDKESSENTSKQGRMIEDIDQDARISLVTPTKVSSQEDQSEDQLGVLSAAKGLADAAKKNVNTYTRRRRAVSIGDKGVSTTSRIFSTTEIIDK